MARRIVDADTGRELRPRRMTPDDYRARERERRAAREALQAAAARAATMTPEELDAEALALFDRFDH